MNLNPKLAVAVGAALLAVTILIIPHQRPATGQTPPTSGGSVDPALIEDLVAANRILAQEGVLDAYGHVSVRHPSDPNPLLNVPLARSDLGDRQRHHGIRRRF
jgi:HCOMODA/2-hydroxy-3-carboxy-muconic semialdehyde decarboxylase